MAAEVLMFLVHLTTTAFMTAIIWFMQIGHYPMLRYVGREAYTTYEQQHVKRVMLPAVMILSLELFSGFYLSFVPTQRLPSLPIHIGLVLLLPIWLSTWLWQVPAHKSLERKFDLRVHAWLINSNWLRTVAWSARLGLLLYALFVSY